MAEEGRAGWAVLCAGLVQPARVCSCAACACVCPGVGRGGRGEEGRGVSCRAFFAQAWWRPRRQLCVAVPTLFRGLSGARPVLPRRLRTYKHPRTHTQTHTHLGTHRQRGSGRRGLVLDRAVEGVAPSDVYTGKDELGRTIKVAGWGSTGKTGDAAAWTVSTGQHGWTRTASSGWRKTPSSSWPRALSTP